MKNQPLVENRQMTTKEFAFNQFVYGGKYPKLTWIHFIGLPTNEALEKEILRINTDLSFDGRITHDTILENGKRQCREYLENLTLKI